MKLAFIFVGGHKEEWATSLADEYQKKIKPFVSTEVIRLKPSQQARASSERKLAEESAALFKQITKDDIVVLCDEQGEEVSSLALSKKLVKLFERGRPRILVIIGGSFGVSDQLRARADWTWSFSRLTFNHHFAQGIALEQVYRALTIWKGIPYHNQ